MVVDNFFTDFNLATDLLKNKMNNEQFGTVKKKQKKKTKKNKQEVPPSLQPDKKRAGKSSLFRFTNTATMVSYVPKRGRCVILLSTMHADDKVGDDGWITGHHSFLHQH
jgi:hypothetical protein